MMMIQQYHTNGQTQSHAHAFRTGHHIATQNSHHNTYVVCAENHICRYYLFNSMQANLALAECIIQKKFIYTTSKHAYKASASTPTTSPSGTMIAGPTPALLAIPADSIIAVGVGGI